MAQGKEDIANKINSKWQGKNIFKDFYDERNKVAGYGVEDWGKIESTVSPEHWAILQKRNEKGWNCNFGWKFHLDVIPNRSHPITQEISDFLLNANISHKIAAGGDLGKGMTVYVGSFDDLCELAAIVHQRFGDKIFIPPYFASQVAGEHAFQPTVYGSFCVSDVICSSPQYGMAVRPILEPASVNAGQTRYKKILECIAEAKNTLKKIPTLKVVEHFFDRVPDTDEKLAFLLRLYCSHKLYVRAFGAYYCGKNLDFFERKIFGNKIPAIGTEMRKNFDIVADSFVTKAENNGFLQQLINASGINGYIPVNFDEIAMNRLADNIAAKWQRG